jgi:hypothetical protein
MFLKRNSLLMNKDIYFTLICIGIIVLTSITLNNDINSRITNNDAVRVGEITFKRNSARRQYDGYLVWEELDRTSPVFNLDTIQTSEDSDAHLLLDGGIDIALAENALVVVNTSPQGFDIEFSGGEINTTASKQLMIRYESTVIVLDEGTSFSMKETENNTAELTVYDGNATVKRGDATQEVSGNSKAELTQNAVSVNALNFQKRRPLNSKILVSNENSMNVTFDWSSNLTDETLLVSKNRAFTSSVYSGKEPATVDLETGRYFWKISTSTSESEVFSFTIVKEPLPKILAPQNGESLPTMSGDAKFEVRWLNQGNADSFTLLVYQQGSSSPFKEINTFNNSAFVSELSDGAYQVRVRSNFSFAQDAKEHISEPVTFTVAKRAGIPSVQISAPKQNAQIPTASTDDNGIFISWKTVREIKQYKVSLYSTDSSTNAIFTSTVNGSSTSADVKLIPGDYTVSVVPIYENREGNPSTVDFRVVDLVAPRLLSPTTSQLYSVSQPVQFAWHDASDSFSYVVEIAESRNFQSIKKSFSSNSKSARTTVSDPGDYFARVSITNESGETVATSEPKSFTVAGPLQTPSFQNRYRRDTINISKANSLETGWESINDATVYRVELLRIPGDAQTEALVSIETEDNYYSYPEFRTMQTGRYAFRITALLKKSGRVITQSESSIHYFNVNRTQKIEIKNPSVIYIKED